jgi:hypothetical protein
MCLSMAKEQMSTQSVRYDLGTVQADNGRLLDVSCKVGGVEGPDAPAWPTARAP